MSSDEKNIVDASMDTENTNKLNEETDFGKDINDIDTVDELSMFSKNAESITNESDMGEQENIENSSFASEAEEKDVTEDFSNKKKGSVKRKMLFLLLLLLIGAAAFVVIPRLGGTSVGDDEADNVAGQIYLGLPDDFDADEVLAQLQQKVDASAFTINVNSRPIFANGSAKAEIDIINNPGNNYPCKVAIALADTGDVVYQNNDLMYPDQHIPYIRLSKNLKKGVYDAILTYYIFDTEGKEQVGVMSAGLEIVVQN